MYNLIWTKKFEKTFKFNNLFYLPCFYISIKVVSLMFVLISIVSSQTTVPNSISVYPTIRSKLFGLLNILFIWLSFFFILNCLKFICSQLRVHQITLVHQMRLTRLALKVPLELNSAAEKFRIPPMVLVINISSEYIQR